jgi:hypothetical protein
MKASNKSRALARKRRLARIDWIQSKLEIPEDDSIFRLHELAEPIGPLTNAQIDAVVYGK